MPHLTPTEETALRAVKAATDAINRPSLSPSMIFDYCDLSLRFEEFTDALEGLLRMGLIEGNRYFYLTEKGKEVEA